MWTNGANPVSLGLAPGYFGSHALGVSDNLKVVGYLEDSPGRPTAGIWTPEFGMEPLTAYMARFGITAPAGVHLNRATAISADGNVIVGYTGTNTAGPYEGFVVIIPAPGAAWAPAAGLLAATRRRRA